MTTQALLRWPTTRLRSPRVFRRRTWIANIWLPSGKRALFNPRVAHISAEAATLVSAVPTNWTYKILHSRNSQRQWNGVYEFMWLESRWVESNVEGLNGLAFRDDPRNPFLFAAGATFDGQDDFYGTLRYSAPDSSTVLASGIEARLIEAEAALQVNNITTFLAKLNEPRASSGIAGLAPLTDPGNVNSATGFAFQRAGTVAVSHRSSARRSSQTRAVDRERWLRARPRDRVPDGRVVPRRRIWYGYQLPDSNRGVEQPAGSGSGPEYLSSIAIRNGDHASDV